MAAPASALERLELRLPFLETSITIHLEDGRSAAELIRSSPDLADLQGASGGQLLGLLENVFETPLPVEIRAFLEGSTAQPLLEQALLAVMAVVELQGVEADSTGRMLTDALIRAERRGQPNVLGLLREMPGESVSVDLSLVARFANRLKSNMQEGIALVRNGAAAEPTPSLQASLKPVWNRSELKVAVSHRPDPLQVLVLEPRVGSNGRLVVISHGLWDDPESFEG